MTTKEEAEKLVKKHGIIKATIIVDKTLSNDNLYCEVFAFYCQVNRELKKLKL